ncbi:hypothetical protein [Poritiphilus flavus]|uniref:DUF3299 domain-containing protein n=1 Tax=Poritiphilus flavus TaxID=2697053 RepID=A0A6L9E779_9FLAO|nr:hypothetical protein [Poritiphilus flavus]NAS10635.1 hypothetical protein [Poritiphilus flavus]
MRLFLIIVLCLIGTEIHAQTLLSWADLSNGISWDTPSPETYFPEFQEANFSYKMKGLEGEKVIITGYLLVMDVKRSVYLLSKNPMASCFFCGNGGPETVVDLQFDENPPFEMDELISVQGLLRLNPDDPNACYYKIEKADAVSLR